MTQTILGANGAVEIALAVKQTVEKLNKDSNKE